MEPPADSSGSANQCPSCGEPSLDGDAFCGECGAILESVPAVAGVAAVTPPPPAMPQPPSMSPPGAITPPPDAAQSPHEPKTNGAGGLGAPDAQDVLRGVAVGNEVYHGQRLAYQSKQQGVEDFNPLSAAFSRVVILRFLAASIATWFSWVLLIPLLIVALLIAGEGGAEALMYLFAIAGLGVWIFFFFRSIPVPLAEWKFLVDDKAAAAPAAFEHISWAFRRRQSPVASLRVRRLGQVNQKTRDYLEVKDGVFTSYVSCFAYGGDLYIAWTFWWNLSPFRWCLIAIGRLWQLLTMRGSYVHILARYENGKALREAVHAAAREGIDVAAGSIAAQGAGTIGSEIPVELVSAPAELPGFLARAESGEPIR
jgi:hypothetical protein